MNETKNILVLKLCAFLCTLYAIPFLDEKIVQKFHQKCYQVSTLIQSFSLNSKVFPNVQKNYLNIE